MTSRGGRDKWSDRFRARMDEAAASRVGSPEELYQRELSFWTVWAWGGVLAVVVMTFAFLVGGMPWWSPLVLVVTTLGNFRQLRIARRRGGPRPSGSGPS